MSQDGKDVSAQQLPPVELSEAARLNQLSGFSGDSPRGAFSPASLPPASLPPAPGVQIDDPARHIAQLQAALEHRERQIEALQRSSEALLSHDTVDDMLRETLRLAIDVLRADAGAIQMHDSANDTLVFRYVLGLPEDRLLGFAVPISKGVAGRVFRSGACDLTLNVDEQPDFNHEVDDRADYRTKSLMSVPVKRREGKPLGVMQVLNARTSFDERDLEVLQVLVAQAALAIENARATQEARQAQIVNVIGDISHDIKNMLTPIQTGLWTLEPLLDDMFRDLDAMRAENPDAEIWSKIERATAVVREDYGWILSNACDSADKVQARTKEIADAFKGEMAPPRFEEADLNETAREVVRALRLVALDAQVGLDLDLDAELPPAQFDRQQMYNALYNLMNNAIAATPEEGVVTVRTRGPQPDEPRCTIEVEDTGHGMPEHIRASLFTDEAISTKPGGTGLGTRIVAGIVRRHYGTITAQSAEGAGSIFTIHLPLRHQEPG